MESEIEVRSVPLNAPDYVAGNQHFPRIIDRNNGITHDVWGCSEGQFSLNSFNKCVLLFLLRKTQLETYIERLEENNIR
jgi:hypothetical protein